MFTRSFLVLFSSLTLVPIWSAPAAPNDLVLYWPFDEGSGTTVKDRSGNGNDGTIEGGVLWVPGMVRTALQFNGANSVVAGPHIPFNNRSFTHAMWVNPSSLAAVQSVFSQYQASSANQGLHYRIGTDGSVRMGFYSNDLDIAAGTVRASVWYHLTFLYDLQTQNRRIYVNGVLAGQGSSAPYLGATGDTLVGTFRRPDRPDRVPEWFDGMIDDVQLYDRALADAEIQEIMLGLRDPSLAYDPSPADGAADVPADVSLSWSAGESAISHDVYLGTALEDVNEAGRNDARGVLVGRDQTATHYDPADPLDFGTVYYWRVDEVAAPGNAITKGEVWSFTVEPYAYPITGVTATASSAQPDRGPENTVNGSGLDDSDGHSTELKDMWLTDGAAPAWIQFQLDRAYKLDAMWVWNSNQAIESIVGFGAKDVAIEYSVDGQAWTTLADAAEFAQASGLPTYSANTTVDLGGVMARFVKLTIKTNWGGVAPQTGLSEVRFFHVPVQAFAPEPPTGAVGVAIDAVLNWRPGRGASSHTVYIGPDRAAVAEGSVPGNAVADHAYSPADLTFATEYFWKVDEAGDFGFHAGTVWVFTTAEFAVIDDFEGYDDDIDAGTTLYQAWVDGMTTHASGSTVGYMESSGGTFGERKIVHRGGQSMPLTYDNAASPFYSEAERTFDSPQDWTAHGADVLSLHFQGIAENSAEGLYVTIKDSSGKSRTVAHPDAAATRTASWQQWKIPLAEFASAGVKMTSVKSLTIGIGKRTGPAAGGAGKIYIDDIGFGRSAE